MKRKMSPVLKWAGGKTQLLEIIRSRMPESYNTYFEPFIGGGAVVLDLCPSTAVINDCNEQLVNLYMQLKKAPYLLAEYIAEFDNYACDKTFYLSMRERYNRKIIEHQLDTECAALMVWINKHCFNGLYRVNNKGLFNVPYNNRITGRSFDADNIIAIGKYLNSADVKILCSDFEIACQEVKAGDFVYFDSPYIPAGETAYFTDYTKTGFLPADHERLAELFIRLDRLGAKLMLSNNDVPLARDLYKGFNIQAVEVRRMINSNASKRTGREILVTNY